MPEGTSSPPSHMDSVPPSSSGFPPLVNSPGLARVIPKSWNKMFETTKSSPNPLKFSHFPSEPDIIPFSGEKLSHGGEDWKLCMVGYSIGRRPYYEALLSAVKKTWSLKGEVQLLSLNDGFFLFRFSCVDDFESVWSRGVWFILGKPFVLQKWHPKFVPKKEDFASVPIWVKIHDLPLACWNSEGISRIASKIGISVAADSLTEQKTRLTYARICVLVDCHAAYPEEIQVSLDGEVVCLRVQYEWHPSPCQHYKSLMHFSSSCLKNPEKASNDQEAEKGKTLQNNRGRSMSRKPPRRPNSNPGYVVKMPISKADIQETTNHVPANNIIAIPSSVTGQNLHYQPHSPTSNKLNSKTYDLALSNTPVIGDQFSLGIPNLNSPNAVSSSSSTNLQTTSAGQVFISPNKFDLLNAEGDMKDNSNNSGEDLDNEAANVDFLGKDKKPVMLGKQNKKNETTTAKKPAKGKQGKKPQNKQNS
ncbi:uncharacterized protein LOC110097149 [Dendrobium catenatum]|uniref:uncharacterized protein LOC110097149 n=1 Tax=Dendrobium catenatum TaxID=906689 RepID=UPI0009F549C3|nr:uncharacterized protein LOC110097149 [Dendrobium catenatum]